MLTRRRLLTGTLLALAAPLAVEAQQAAKVYQVALLSGAAPSEFQPEVLRAFLQRLDELGWQDGRNIVSTRASTSST